MIFYGANLVYSYYFLLGVVVTLFVVCLALCIASEVMKRKTKKMEKTMAGGKGHDGK